MVRHLFIVLLAVSFMGGAMEAKAASGTSGVKGKIRVELFVMSQCPYGVAAEKALLPVVRQYADRIDFTLYFIAQDEEMKKEAEKSGEPVGGGGCSGSPEQGIGPFYSLHGQPEVDEDIRQAVMARHFSKKYFDYILCRADNYKDDAGWEKCAVSAGIDVKKVRELVTSKETEELFRENIQKAWGLGIGSSPTILINGKRYDGRRDSMSLARQICSIAPDIKDCATLPVCSYDDDCYVKGKEGICIDPNSRTARCETAEPTRFGISILTSKDCTGYNLDGFKQITTHYFPQVSYRQVDVATPEGKAMAGKYGVEMLPAMIFSKDIEKSIRFARVRNVLEDKKDAWLMKPQASGSPCELGPGGKVIQKAPAGQKAPAEK